jgi:hypothetical protein
VQRDTQSTGLRRDRTHGAVLGGRPVDDIERRQSQCACRVVCGPDETQAALHLPRRIGHEVAEADTQHAPGTGDALALDTFARSIEPRPVRVLEW